MHDRDSEAKQEGPRAVPVKQERDWGSSHCRQALILARQDRGGPGAIPAKKGREWGSSHPRQALILPIPDRDVIR